MKFLLAAAAALSLSGCATTYTNTAPVQYVSISPELQAETAGVSVVAAPSPGAVSLGAITASACQRLTSDPVPTPEYAIALLKQQAVKIGATTVAGVSTSKSAVSIVGNCWTTITAKGTAYRP